MLCLCKPCVRKIQREDELEFFDNTRRELWCVISARGKNGLETVAIIRQLHVFWHNAFLTNGRCILFLFLCNYSGIKDFHFIKSMP